MMSRMRYALCLLLSTGPLLATTSYEQKVSVLYDTIDPNSLTALLAFYHLYGESDSGKKAFIRALELINRHRKVPLIMGAELPQLSLDIESIIALVVKGPNEEAPLLSERDSQICDRIASHLLNRSLKGYQVWSKEGLLTLEPEELDLARGILLHQFGDNDKGKIRSYEAILDIMALQILAKLPKGADALAKLEAINDFIFHEMRYRFPPHSLWAKDVDVYTFLPSILDSRHGVCLGVSILYLSLAQRLGLPLEIITPPGHIYLSYVDKERVINIETTARGVDVPSENYLSINTLKLQKRTIKEVIGLHFMNAAATAWHKKNHKGAIELYQEAMQYLPKDPLLASFLGYNLLFFGDEKEAKKYLTYAKDHPLEEMVYPDTTIADYLAGKIDKEGILVMYQHVDETRESIYIKQNALKKILDSYPEFREGIFHLAVTYLQLGRSREAMPLLERYHALDAHNPVVEYYLAIVAKERLDFAKAYEHLGVAEALMKSKGHTPRALEELQRSLRKEALPLN
jgi:tetratricopeptide (TPR) repeat protein